MNTSIFMYIFLDYLFNNPTLTQILILTIIKQMTNSFPVCLYHMVFDHLKQALLKDTILKN